MKKAVMLSLVLVAGALASCGETSSLNSSSATSSAGSSSVSAEASSSVENLTNKHYEFAGTNDELYDMFGAFETYAVLENGTGKIYDGSVSNKDNVLTYTEVSLNYKIETDEDGITELTAVIDGAKVKSTMASDNSFELTFTHQIGGSGFSRPVVLKGSTAVLYSNVSAWETAINAKYADRKVTVTEEAVYTGIVTEVGKTEQYTKTMGGYTVPFSAKVTIFSDFTVEACYGAAGAESFTSFGKETGTWTTGADKVRKITINEVEYTVVDSATTETFTWAFTYGEGDGAINLESIVTYTKAV